MMDDIIFLEQNEQRSSKNSTGGNTNANDL